MVIASLHSEFMMGRVISLDPHRNLAVIAVFYLSILAPISLGYILLFPPARPLRHTSGVHPFIPSSKFRTKMNLLWEVV